MNRISKTQDQIALEIGRLYIQQMSNFVLNFDSACDEWVSQSSEDRNYAYECQMKYKAATACLDEMGPYLDDHNKQLLNYIKEHNKEIYNDLTH